MALFKCKVFTPVSAKNLYLPLAQCDTPMEIHIATMSKFYKNGLNEPFLWNYAAYAT